MQGQLSGLQYFISFLKIIGDFDAFMSTEIRSHIFAPSVLIDFLPKCTVLFVL